MFLGLMPTVMMSVCILFAIIGAGMVVYWEEEIERKENELAIIFNH